MNIYKEDNVKLLNILEGHNTAVSSLCFNSSAQIFSLSKDNNIRSWEIISGKLLKSFTNPNEKIKMIKYLFKSNEIYFLGANNNINILNAKDLSLINEIDFNLSNIVPYKFDISKDEGLLAVAFSDNKIRIYREGYKIYSILSTQTKAEITNLVFSPNYKYLCASFSDNTMKVWNISVIDSLKDLKWHDGYITSIVFSPDSKYIFSSSYDRKIKVWDSKSGENIYTLKGHTGYINSIDISSDSKYLISASHDLTVKIWSLNSFTEIESLKAHISPVLSVAFHPDGQHFASGSSDKTINIWKIMNNILDNSDSKDINENYSNNSIKNNSNFEPKYQTIPDIKKNNDPIKNNKPMDIYSLLSFNPNNILTSTDIITSDTKKNIEKNISKINLLIKDIEKNDVKSPDQIPEIYRLFLRSTNNLESVFDSVSKARRLAWAISYSEKYSKPIIETDNFISALRIIDKFWTYTMFHGLFDTYLKIWYKDNNPNINNLKQFLALKLFNYKKSLSSILKLKENEKYFFNNNGAFSLGTHFFTLGKDISQVLDILNLPNHMISYNYFSDFILSYTQDVLRSSLINKHLGKIIIFLEKNNDKSTIKKCLSKIILNINRLNNFELQEEIKVYSFKLIGDPSIDSLWMPWENASNQEILELRDAQNTINNWITQQFIELFFSNVTMDIDRKNFWEKYLKNIKKFKIYGTQYQYKMMKNDKRIEPYLSTRFGFLTGGSDSMNAFIMYIKDYILIEFSSTGNAFYGYKTSNRYCPDTTKKELSVSSLKRKDFADIRITHIGNWQDTTSKELRNKIGV